MQIDRTKLLVSCTQSKCFGPREEPMSLGKPVMPAESEAKIECEEVRITISAGKMEEVDEAPHDIENQKDPLEKELDNLSSLSTSRCIYRVPKRLRQGNEEAYTPQVVSIGPLHHGKKPLKAMEEHKKRYLQVFLSRTRERVSFSDYMKMIKDQERRLRGFYAESNEFSPDEFVRIVLVDAAFVIEFLLRYYYICFKGEDDYSQGEDDYIFNNPGMLWDVLPDLRLLENQLPFFILQALFTRCSSSSSHQLPPLLEISYRFFEGGGKEENFAKICSSGEEVKHFVDLIRILYRPLEPKSKTSDTHNITATPTVTELHQAGVKFKIGKGSSLFDIKFSRGILEIPKLTVDDSTDLKLRNFLAFEQCHHREEDYLANYVFLMKRLVKAPKDVQLLVEKGIIENWLGDTQKISTLLHDLGTRVKVDHNYYATICEDLIEFRGKYWPRSMVTLKQDYFNTPWAIVSFAAAVFLLVLTCIQTVCSFISVL